MPKTKKQAKTNYKQLALLLLVALAFGIVIYCANRVMTTKKAEDQLNVFRASPLLKIRPLAGPTSNSSALLPDEVKNSYNLTGENTGSGTIAIVNAYNNPRAAKDLAKFSKRFGLRPCTKSNQCFEKHKMSSGTPVNKTWALESALDVEWAHAIAPTAKILLVEAKSNSGTDLLRAIDYARSRKDVIAISLSWGGGEFSTERRFNNHFVAKEGAAIFAASGDDGSGTLWPSVSPNVIAVGGTTLRTAGGEYESEIAWGGSGGGLSKYEPTPSYQQEFNVPEAIGKRAVPDVSYNANPLTGFPVYFSMKYGKSSGWFLVGGTSAGAPQWAAIHSRGGNISHAKLYQNAKNENVGNFFRDIVQGQNGTCGFYCDATTGYDYVTGLGSPQTTTY